MHKESNAEFVNLTEDKKAEIVDKLRNYPTLPSEVALAGVTQDEALAKYYPWGCENITRGIRFDVEDMVVYVRLDNLANVCLSIKYGICPFQKPEDLKFLSKILSESKGKIYVKMVVSTFHCTDVYALAEVREVNTSLTFRFWHNETHKPYPVGVALVQVVAVG